MKIKFVALLVLLLVLPRPAYCALITSGTWTDVPAANNDNAPWFDGLSWDCATCGVSWTLAPGAQYLNAGGLPVAFTFSGISIYTDLGGTSDYLAQHTIGYTASGEFTLDNGHGSVWSTVHTPLNVVLFRWLTSATRTDYRLWFEDLSPLHTDSDYNDHGIAFYTEMDIPEPPAETVSEPATLLLLGTGLLAIRRRLLQP